MPSKRQACSGPWGAYTITKQYTNQEKNYPSLLINHEFKASVLLNKKINIANVKAPESISGYQGLRGQDYRDKVYGKVNLRQLLFP